MFSYTGKYMDRYNYYNSLHENNLHLDIYNGVVGFYNSRDNIHHWEKSLIKIRNTPGFSRAWGYANAILLDIADEKPINTELLDQLLECILQALPAYVPWYPKAKNPKNQSIINFLQDYSNKYRSIGDPKFYAYDNVINNFSETDITITKNNCGYFDGVGKFIKAHICNFINVNKIVAQTVEELPDSNLLSFVNTNNSYIPQTIEQEQSEVNIPESDEREKPDVAIPESIEREHTEMLPISRLTDPNEKWIQQTLICTLWYARHFDMAKELNMHYAIPQTRKEFAVFENCNENVINSVFVTSVNLISVNNWLNSPLVEWLYTHPKKGAYRYACREVAYTKLFITMDNLEEVKYIGKKIATDIRNNFYTNWIPNKKQKVC